MPPSVSVCASVLHAHALDAAEAGGVLLAHGLDAAEAGGVPLSLLVTLLGGALAGLMTLLGRRRDGDAAAFDASAPADAEVARASRGARRAAAAIGLAGAVLVITAAVLGSADSGFNLVVVLVLQVAWGAAALLAIAVGP